MLGRFQFTTETRCYLVERILAYEFTRSAKSHPRKLADKDKSPQFKSFAAKYSTSYNNSISAIQIEVNAISAQILFMLEQYK